MVDPVIRQWAGVRTLPYFLQDAFELYELKIRDLSILLAVNRRAKTLRLTAVRGQVDKLKSLADRPPAETWHVAKPLLRSPLKRSVWILRTAKLHPEQRLPLAGLSALARYSQLAEPALSVYAVDYAKWKVLAQGGLPTLPESQAGSFQLQVWNYTPMPMPDNKTVDPLSLSLSLQNDSDERVQCALEELQEHFPWRRDSMFFKNALLPTRINSY